MSTAGVGSRARSVTQLVRRAMIALSLAVVAWQVFVPPIVGIADNGDFGKVLGYVGLQHSAGEWEDLYYRSPNRKFEFAPLGWYRSGYLTSEIPLALIARALGRVTSPDGRFDVRWIGAIHGAILALGIAAIASAVPRVGSGAFLLGLGFLCFAVTDEGYVAALNAFYGQTASVVSLFVVVGAALLWMRRLSSPGFLPALFFVGAAVFVTSKPQEAPQSLLLAAAFLRLHALGRGRPTKTSWAGALALVALGVACLLAAPRSLRQVAPYHMVFAEILPNSPDPAADLRWFGLDVGLTAYAGMHAYMQTSPIHEPWFEGEFFSKVSSETVVGFYAAHPSRAIELFVRRSKQATTLLPPGFGTLEKETDEPGGAVRRPRFDHWSSWKAALAPAGPLLLGLFFPLNVLVAVARRHRHPRIGPEVFECFAILNLMALGAFAISVLGDALEVERHLFTFNALTDLVIAGDLVWLALAASETRSPSRRHHHSPSSQRYWSVKPTM